MRKKSKSKSNSRLVRFLLVCDTTVESVVFTEPLYTQRRSRRRNVSDSVEKSAPLSEHKPEELTSDERMKKIQSSPIDITSFTVETSLENAITRSVHWNDNPDITSMIQDSRFLLPLQSGPKPLLIQAKSGDPKE